MSNELKLVPALADDEIQVAIEEAISLGYSAADIWSTAVAAAPQMPALGGEPEVAAWLDLEKLKIGNMAYATGMKVNHRQTELIDRAHIAPLQAKIERLKESHRTHAAELITSRGVLRDENDQLKARCDELQAFDIDAAARKLSECIGYPWFGLNIDARDGMRAHAKAVIDAALSKPTECEPRYPISEAGMKLIDEAIDKDGMPS